jgi:uncharacterized protein with von Willebrand factor type A (vWA) domain
MKLRDLAAKAGRFLARQADTRAPEPQTGVVACGKFDQMAWQDTHSQSRRIRELADDLHVRHDYAEELVKDLFLAAYKAEPQVREDIEPGHAVNRQVVSWLLDSPEWQELRRETVGDAHAAAMAVLSQTSAIKRMLDQAEQAQQAAAGAQRAEQDRRDAAQGVAGAIADARAQADEDGEIRDDTADAISQAITAAEQADAAAENAAQDLAGALARAARDMNAAARAAAGRAAEQARDEAAMMTAWGIGPGELQRMSFDERAALAERLRSSRLAEFTSLIGRFRQMAAAQRARRVENVPGEVVGIELGCDIARVVPAELARLAVPGLRQEFITRLVDGRALQYQHRGEAQAGKGAIIACIDCSYSMTDRTGEITGEAWAKAFALSMLDQARAERREFAGILFSSEEQVKIFRFPARHSPATSDVIEFAEHFFGGGTDFEAPLTAAVEILTGQHDQLALEGGDITLITDGISGVSETWMRDYQDAKARLGFRTFGIRIGGPAGSVLDALSDNVRAIEDLTDLSATADIFRAV